jgi:hypothetical protein
MLTFLFGIYIRTVETLGSTFTLMPVLSSDTCDQTYSIISEMERVGGSFLEGKSYRILPVIYATFSG